jgi:hypothetical protein
MESQELRNPVVRAVVVAIRDGDRKAFLAAFAPSAVLTDDGVPQPLAEWADKVIFRRHGLLTVEYESSDGRDLLASFKSDWGETFTSWSFTVVRGRVRRLDFAYT